jgi:4-amino-4-deoxy-L-arabinose transferase-like glycosyltransferase
MSGPARVLGFTRMSGYGRALGLVTALGALLRLALLARQPLGYDEDFTAAVVRLPFGQMLDAVGRDSAPPLFYLLEWPVAQLLPGPAGLRLVPALAGIALIPLLATLARRASGDAAGLWAAAFAAVAPATLASAENARMYSLAGALVVAATLVLWRIVDGTQESADAAAQPSAPRTWIRYAPSGLLAAAAAWTDYFAILALAGVLVAAAWLRPPRRVLLSAGAATGLGAASVGLWLLLAPSQLAHAGQGFWVPPLSVESAAGTLGQLFAGPPVDSGVPGREPLLALQIVAIGAGSAALVAAAAAWRRAPSHFRRGEAFLVLACSGVLVLAAVSVWRPVLEARYAAVMWLPLFALAGAGLAAMPRPPAAVLLAATLAPSLAAGAVATTHPETASLIPEVESRLGPHDLVAADPNHYLLLVADGSPELRARLHVLAGSEPPWYFGTAAYPAGAVVASPPSDVVSAGGTIFWIADPRSAPPALPPGYRASTQRCLIRVCLTIYEAPVTPQ